MESVILAVALGVVVLFLAALWRLAGREQDEMKEHAGRIAAACTPDSAGPCRFRLIQGG